MPCLAWYTTRRLHLMGDAPCMIRELNVIEQRYRAVLEVLSGIPVTEVAERYGVVRQTVHRWMAGYRADGIAGLPERSHAPMRHPWWTPAQVKAVICCLTGRRVAHGRDFDWRRMRNTYWIRKERLDELPNSLAGDQPDAHLEFVGSSKLPGTALPCEYRT